MPRLHDGMRTGTVPRYLLRIKVARARPRHVMSLSNGAARAFEMLRLTQRGAHRDGAALPFSFASNDEINFADIVLAEGFDHLDKLGTGRLNRARRTTACCIV